LVVHLCTEYLWGSWPLPDLNQSDVWIFPCHCSESPYWSSVRTLFSALCKEHHHEVFPFGPPLNKTGIRIFPLAVHFVLVTSSKDTTHTHTLSLLANLKSVAHQCQASRISLALFSFFLPPAPIQYHDSTISNICHQVRDFEIWFGHDKDTHWTRFRQANLDKLSYSPHSRLHTCSSTAASEIACMQERPDKERRNPCRPSNKVLTS
jgi:hypothetical protein